MQIFVPFSSAIDSAMCLDKKRLWKQILEARYIIKCIEEYQQTGNVKALKHPVMKMYKDHISWVKYYLKACEAVRNNTISTFFDKEPERPLFIGWSHLHNSFRRRLYQKGLKDQLRTHADYNHYGDFEQFNSPDESNMYVIDGVAYVYLNSKLLSKSPMKEYEAKFEDLAKEIHIEIIYGGNRFSVEDIHQYIKAYGFCRKTLRDKIYDRLTSNILSKGYSDKYLNGQLDIWIPLK